MGGSCQLKGQSQGLVPLIRGHQGQGTSPDSIWRVMVSECIHAPPQTWGCPPPASVPSPSPLEQGSASRTWKSRTQKEGGSRVSVAMLSKAHAQSSPDVESLHFRETMGPARAEPVTQPPLALSLWSDLEEALRTRAQQGSYRSALDWLHQR